MMQIVQESYFLTGNSTNLTLRTGTISSAERNYDSAKHRRLLSVRSSEISRQVCMFPANCLLKA